MLSHLTRHTVRSLLAGDRPHQNAIAAALVAQDVVGFGLTSLGALLADSPLLRLCCSVANGLFIARLFVLGHDACHGALLSGSRANRWLGRVLFMPSLTPYSLWEAGHNVAHHGYTNLKGRDYVWAPMSKAEFDASPRWRQRLERIYRHPIGFGLYYLIELWWKRLFFPRRTYVGARRTVHTLDCATVTAFAVAWPFLIWTIARNTGVLFSEVVLWCVLVPFGTWNTLMGFVIYVQHTHPSIRWFADRTRWSWLEAQIESTPHADLPWPLSSLLHNIMEHTAHHVDSRVPCYNLARAQARLERGLPGAVRVHRWSTREFAAVVRICKLYDFDRNVWTDFDGSEVCVPGAGSTLR